MRGGAKLVNSKPAEGFRCQSPIEKNIIAPSIGPQAAAWRAPSTSHAHLPPRHQSSLSLRGILLRAAQQQRENLLTVLVLSSFLFFVLFYFESRTTQEPPSPPLSPSLSLSLDSLVRGVLAEEEEEEEEEENLLIFLFTM